MRGKPIIDTLLLTALPASGKSELRRYLALQDPAVIERDFHLGKTVQLDDYPYVHVMRRISEELAGLGQDPIFFRSSDQPFTDARDWGTLIELLNEDYRDLHTRPRIEPASCAAWLFERMDAARVKCGAPARLGALPAPVRSRLERAIAEDAEGLLRDKLAEIPDTLVGRTILVELARGGPQGARMPLPEPLGYAYSLSRFADDILRRASVLYVWVTPEESRRKNDARAKPGRAGDASILHHGVPIAVMLGDYGTDDMAYLIEQSDRPNTLRIAARGSTYDLPVARFDNRTDLTSFLRQDPADWPKNAVAAVHAELKRACDQLVANGKR